MVTKRVCYELNGETGKVDFLGKDKMLQLLKNYPELKQAYLKDDSQEAKHTFKYLLELRNKQKKVILSISVGIAEKEYVHNTIMVIVI